MTNIIKPFKLYPFNTLYIDVEGVGRWVFENPNENGDKIFDRIIDSSLTHNLKSILRLDSGIYLTFVTQDDEDGRMLDEDDVDILYRWLCVKPLTEDEFVEQFLNSLDVNSMRH